MLLAAEDARAFLAGLREEEFLASRLHQAAAIRCLELIGEAAGKVSADLRAREPATPWRAITAMRQRLIHGRAEVLPEIVWRTVQGELPSLIAPLRSILEQGGALDSGAP